MAKKTSLSDLQYYAALHNGRCLNKEFVSAETPAEWACEKGHRFSLSFFLVKQGSWCRPCARENNSRSKKKKRTASKRIKKVSAGRQKQDRFTFIKNFAAEMGGKVLSKTYNEKETKLKFECSNGHAFKRNVQWVLAGNWCSLCEKEKKNEIVFTALKKIAAKRGDKILSEHYKDQHTSLLVECKNGHKRFMHPYTIKHSKQCLICATENKQHRTFEKLKKIIKQKKGKLLTAKYTGSLSPMQYECEHGHKWRSVVSNVMSGYWCPECAARNKSLSIEDMRALAAEKGGQFLSKEYFGFNEKYKWRCSNGHVWFTTAKVIKGGHWCVACRKEKKSAAGEIYLQKMQRLAASRGGKLLSPKFFAKNEKLKWECAEGHIWQAIPRRIEKGQWCKKCFVEQRKPKIEVFQKLAAKRGGKLLSSKYTNQLQKLKWECALGHTWYQTIKAVKSHGSWCPDCAKEKRNCTTASMKRIADERGGKLLSKKYINNMTNLKWQCAKGHVWEAAPSNIKVGRWCRFCSRDYKKPPIEQLQKLAESRGGKLLTKEYINNRTKMKWQCAEGHTWMQSIKQVKNKGTWCRKCSYVKQNRF